MPVCTASTSDTALVQTVDFFTPIVDDPCEFGSIAAANALSDVYAMGGTPISRRSPSPRCRARVSDPGGHHARSSPAGSTRSREAGVALLGGHTVQDVEVKFGYAVTGLVTPGTHWTNAGARPGDVAPPHQAARHRHRLDGDQARARPRPTRCRRRWPRCSTLNRPRGRHPPRRSGDGVGPRVHRRHRVRPARATPARWPLASGVRLQHPARRPCPCCLAPGNSPSAFRPGGTANNEAHFGAARRGRPTPSTR